jgi:hypothetical protein
MRLKMPHFDFDNWANSKVVIPHEQPWLIKNYNPELRLSEKIPYTQTHYFDFEIAQARIFLKNLYLRGVDIEISSSDDLIFVPMPNEATEDEITVAKRLQHGIAYQISHPIDLFGQESSHFLDDRNTCISCKNLSAQKTCLKSSRNNLAWFDSKWLDKSINCKEWRSQ